MADGRMDMRLITGGAWQGKTAFARTLETGRDPETRKEGEADQVPPEEWKHLDLLCHVHRWVRRAVQEGSWDRQWFEALVREMADRQPELLVTMDEVGCGIVPMEEEERRFREAAGEAGQILAAHSREVWRVICGAGARIR